MRAALCGAVVARGAGAALLRWSDDQPVVQGRQASTRLNFARVSSDLAGDGRCVAGTVHLPARKEKNGCLDLTSPLQAENASFECCLLPVTKGCGRKFDHRLLARDGACPGQVVAIRRYLRRTAGDGNPEHDLRQQSRALSRVRQLALCAPYLLSRTVVGPKYFFNT